MDSALILFFVAEAWRGGGAAYNATLESANDSVCYKVGPICFSKINAIGQSHYSDSFFNHGSADSF